MISLPAIDTADLVNFLTRLLNTPSPTGFTHRALSLTEQALEGLPVTMRRTRKGALVIRWEGERNTAPRGLTAHVDTLGAMVKEIKPNGRLKLTKVGGFAWNTVEGENCTVFTRSGREVRGTLLLTKASSHVHSSAVSETKREDDAMEVRLDERTTSAEQTRALGIEVGDFVAFDPRVEVINGFVRSRHLDDKACVACVVAAFKALHAAGKKPAQTTIALISNYEEVGHGAATGFPPEMSELLVVDMAAVGDGQNSDEFHASLCVKDSRGPYHHEMSNRLRDLAEAHQIPYRVDIYPYYGSDGEAYWYAGGDVAVALIGPGVDASHNYERTHIEALEATTRWILAYLLAE
ncbi:M42 family metallopeptidase [Anaerolinea thermophila]|uniref:Peptidase M42 family protein n=1 Tax=Anaerolinea thermophila (strain DSM 14523 / JCM 11388 / NBRC 100420 / UNI-1) TaxID=926569 RepID=E8N2D2_ANATU|nr:M42 family metallopeptidase [Anaerolinea thermophila]BAJ62738.1 peptidase M42 family protein [Anaerolinea thermophila UNI-1]